MRTRLARRGAIVCLILGAIGCSSSSSFKPKSAAATADAKTAATRPSTAFTPPANNPLAGTGAGGGTSASTDPFVAPQRGLYGSPATRSSTSGPSGYAYGDTTPGRSGGSLSGEASRYGASSDRYGSTGSFPAKASSFDAARSGSPSPWSSTAGAASPAGAYSGGGSYGNPSGAGSGSSYGTTGSYSPAGGYSSTNAGAGGSYPGGGGSYPNAGGTGSYDRPASYSAPYEASKSGGASSMGSSYGRDYRDYSKAAGGAPADYGAGGANCVGGSCSVPPTAGGSNASSALPPYGAGASAGAGRTAAGAQSGAAPWGSPSATAGPSGAAGAWPSSNNYPAAPAGAGNYSGATASAAGSPSYGGAAAAGSPGAAGGSYPPPSSSSSSMYGDRAPAAAGGYPASGSYPPSNGYPSSNTYPATNTTPATNGYPATNSYPATSYPASTGAGGPGDYRAAPPLGSSGAMTRPAGDSLAGGSAGGFYPGSTKPYTPRSASSAAAVGGARTDADVAPVAYDQAVSTSSSWTNNRLQ